MPHARINNTTNTVLRWIFKSKNGFRKTAKEKARIQFLLVMILIRKTINSKSSVNQTNSQKDRCLKIPSSNNHNNIFHLWKDQENSKEIRIMVLKHQVLKQTEVASQVMELILTSDTISENSKSFQISQMSSPAMFSRN